jgi:hypothetical protein
MRAVPVSQTVKRIACQYCTRVPTPSRLFQKTLDDNLVCIQLNCAKCQHADGGECVNTLIKRAQNAHGLTTVVHSAAGSLVSYLADHITTLYIIGKSVNVKSISCDLKRLPRLTTLCLGAADGDMSGLEHISGLTKLLCFQ